MTSSRKRVRFLSPAELEEALREVARIAREEGVAVALIGGYAMQLYGSDRLTADLDLAANGSIEGLGEGSLLSFGGVQVRASNGVPIDLVLRSDAYERLYDEVVEKAGRAKGIPVPVARPEYLAAMKMVAGRGKDETDLEYLLASGVLDVKKTRAVILRHLGPYAVDAFERFRDEVAWRKSRGSRA